MPEVPGSIPDSALCFVIGQKYFVSLARASFKPEKLLPDLLESLYLRLTSVQSRESNWHSSACATETRVMHGHLMDRWSSERI